MNVKAEWTIKDNTLELDRKIIEQGAPRALKAIGIMAETYAKENCPVDTGLLHNSITFAVSGYVPHVRKYGADKGKGNRVGSYGGTFGKKSDYSVVVGSNVEYAAPNEFHEGRAHMTGRAHFLRDAMAEHKDEYIHEIEAAMKSVMDM